MGIRKAIRCGAVLSALGVSFLTAILSGMNLDGHSDNLAIVLLARPGLVPQDTMGEIAAMSTEESRGSRWDAVVANSSNDMGPGDSASVETEVVHVPPAHAVPSVAQALITPNREYARSFTPATIGIPEAEDEV